MKRIFSAMIAVLAAGAMLLAFAACDEKKEDAAGNDTATRETFMKEMLEDITSNPLYQEWKQMNPESRIEEKQDGSKIIFTVKNELDPADFNEDDYTNDAPVFNGEYVYTYDGDYVVYTAEKAALLSNPFNVQVMKAICNHYDISFIDANEYLAGHEDNTYYIIDNEANTVRIYAAAKWNLE